jgi:hypothetical protein
VRLFGPRRHEQEARDAEHRGDYAQAAALFAEAGLLEEAARVTILRGDQEKRPTTRMRHYARAASLAPEGSALQKTARTKRALALVALASEGPATAAARRDLAEAARELESLGDHELAADAYARADDTEGQLRALEHAGSIEAVEALLDRENARDQAERTRRRDHDEFALLVASGRRREAVAIADASPDAALRELGRAVASRRVAGSEARLVVNGRPTHLLLGDCVVVGRAPAHWRDGARVAPLVVPSAALSRDHLMMFRRGKELVVRDLGSRHGTTVRGLELGADVTVGDGLELRLGGAVTLLVEPAARAGDVGWGLSIQLGTSRFVAPLGPVLVGVGRWRLERAADDWVELVTDDDPPAFAGSLRWEVRATLLAGDAIASERGGSPSIAVEG